MNVTRFSPFFKTQHRNSAVTLAVGISIVFGSFLAVDAAPPVIVTMGKANLNLIRNGLVGYWPLDGKTITLSTTPATALDLVGGYTGSYTNMAPQHPK
jgi:hypothetical protein